MDSEETSLSESEAEDVRSHRHLATVNHRSQNNVNTHHENSPLWTIGYYLLSSKGKSWLVIRMGNDEKVKSYVGVL